MASASRLRLLLHRRFSTTLSSDSATRSSRQKTRDAIRLLQAEKNPERILDICRSASLTPELHLDRVAFSIAISRLTESKSFESISSYLDELKTRPDLRNERYMSHAIVLYGQAGLLDHAINTFKQMDELGVSRSARSLNALLFACIVTKRYDEVSQIFKEYPKTYGITPNLDTYNAVIKALCESGSSSSVYSVLAEMDRNGVKPNATSFDTLLVGFYKEEKFQDVGKTLELMKKHGFVPNINTYNSRIQSLCKFKQSAEAKALFEGMLSRDIKPNTVTYSNLIHGFCKEGDLEEAKRLFNDMPSKGCAPDGICYFTLIHFLCQGKDFDAALKFCKESMQKDWFPNYSTMKTLVNGLASISKFVEARELVDQMKVRFPKTTGLWKEVEEALPQ